ncbi:MAG TPA: hypothetical protein VGQ13_08985 [Nitrososphaera sp.]|nr:hypothetical protein [Nitrososphaera sp.]
MSSRTGDRMNIAKATITSAAAAAILPALLFFATGDGAVKLFRTPHVGQADRNDPYRLPQTEQSTQESGV